MPSICGTFVQATTLRVTKVSACGAKISGAGNAAISNGMTSVEIQPQEESGAELVALNGAGQVVVAKRAKPSLKWDNVVITLAQVDPELVALLTGDTLVMNDAATPQAVGLQQRRSTYALGSFALETWTNTDGMVCTTVSGATVPYFGYSLLPFVVNGVLSNLKWENAAVSCIINANTQNGNAWGVGPWNVLNLAVAGTASPLLTALPTDTHHHMQWTTLAPPSASCGAIAVT